MLFQRKKDSSLRLCIDYRVLNKVTVKNKYPIPLILNLFDQLGRTRYFTKLDLRSGYHQIRIIEGDEAKSACVIRNGSFEFLVMSFGHKRTGYILHFDEQYFFIPTSRKSRMAPATFCSLMNNIFHSYLEKFVAVYLDDIVVYNVTLEEHTEHLQSMFKILTSNQLFMKKEKCSFTRQE
ncbi:RNA-directed DNA polymerase-like protein, partial [Drosera capensis]